MSNTQKARCYGSQHLHPREWGLLDVLLRITHGGERTLFFNGCNVATWFSGASKSSIYRSVHILESEGWLIPENGSGRKRAEGSARYEATRYRVLTHDEWVKKHGTKQCKTTPDEPVPSTGMESPEPFPKSQNSIPKIESSHSQNHESPFPYLGSSSVIESSVSSNSVKTSPVGGPHIFLENYSDRGQDTNRVSVTSGAAVPKDGNGCEEPVKPDWDAIQQKVEAEERTKAAKRLTQ